MTSDDLVTQKLRQLIAEIWQKTQPTYICMFPKKIQRGMD